jgi:tetratricopeptide (TPR) repeat protein
MHTPDSSRRNMKITSRLLIVLQLLVCRLSSQTAPEQTAVLEWNSRFQCGQQHYRRSELFEAEGCYRSALAIAEQFVRGDHRRGATLTDLGMVLLEQGRISDAERAGSKAVEAYRECGVPRCNLGIATALFNLALIYEQQNRRFEAEKLLREALALYSRSDGDPAAVAAVFESLGWLELYRQRPGAAKSYFSRGLALIGNAEGLDRARGSLYASLSFALLELNRPRDATEAAQQGLAAASAIPGIRPLEIAGAACAVAAASVEMGDYALAERAVMRAQEMVLQVPQAEPRELGYVLQELGKLRFFQKRFAEAAEIQSRSLEILSRHLSADHPIILRSKANYAKVLRKLKRNRDAKRVEQEIRTALRQTVEDPDAKYRISASDLKRSR